MSGSELELKGVVVLPGGLFGIANVSLALDGGAVYRWLMYLSFMQRCLPMVRSVLQHCLFL